MISFIKLFHRKRGVQKCARCSQALYDTGVQFFDLTGDEFENTEQGLLCSEAEIANEASNFPVDRTSRHKLCAHPFQAFNSASLHDAVIFLSY